MEERVYNTPKRIDITIADVMDQELKSIVEEDISNLVIDMSETVYISSVGLRSILSVQKIANKKKMSVILINVHPQVKEVFDLTGFSGFLRIEG